MLRFTGAGVVPTPTTVQIRVTAALPGRLTAGAPVPERSLSDDEVRANLHHFVVALRGPRTTPCTGLVLSGVRLAERHDLADAVRDARRDGLRRVTLHLGPGQRDALRTSPLGALVDNVAIVVRGPADLADVAALQRDGLAVTSVVPLDASTLTRLDTTVSGLVAVRARRVVLTWPLFDPPPPHAARVAARLPDAVRALSAVVPTEAIVIKGLPLCALGPLAAHGSRTSNRWYVDAAHQQGEALLFFPDVLRMAKHDVCRTCIVEARCDGAPARWLDQRLAGRLRPVTRS